MSGFTVKRIWRGRFIYLTALFPLRHLPLPLRLRLYMLWPR